MRSQRHQQSNLDDSKILFVTGMHRSHTSLLAHALMHAGLYLGDDLIEAEVSNPYGHFESKSIVDFHRDIIQKQRLASWWSKVDLKKIKTISSDDTFDPLFKEAWSPSTTHAYSGWKDPRAALFLDMWSRIYPTAKFIITLRHPIEVVRSLDKRVLQSSRIGWKPLLSSRHFNHWLVTNQLILDWVEQHRQKSHVLHTPHSLLGEEKNNLLNLQLKKWGIDLTVRFEEVIDPTLIRLEDKEDRISRLYDKRNDVRKVYEKLLEFADSSYTPE